MLWTAMIAERLRVYIQYLSPVTLPALFATVCVIGFLLGSIPFGLLISRRYGVDIRKAGSGNIGMTNVWRTLGWKPGLTVLLLDTLKGSLAVLLAGYLVWEFEDFYYTLHPTLKMTLWHWHAPIWAGVAAILGHTFTPWLRFKGGKGVATGLGVAIVLYYWWLLIPLAVFAGILLISRMVSLSSILAAATLAVLPLFIPELSMLRLFGLMAFLLVLYTHRANIQRILNGTENKVSFGKRQDVDQLS